MGLTKSVYFTTESGLREAPPAAALPANTFMVKEMDLSYN